ncbi:hypothetical protein [Synechococcus phage DSL-LC03]|nr:hypothetical protein [Synechococcus phage DSL-LC03]
MKYLYLINYWVPFPASEYGGVVSVIAENDEECYDLIVEWDNEYYVEYYPQAMENIQKASKFLLAQEEESRIVDAFTT